MCVGLDLVRVSDIAASVDQFGDHFLKRVFTEGELRYCLSAAPTAAPRLAARFAAKEAARKVLCLDNEGIGWQSTEVVRAENGSCELALHGAARTLARKGGYIGFSLSMTHESEYASAVVIGERSFRKDASR
jgi:holo-[acyl-carrier protein] synthase